MIKFNTKEIDKLSKKIKGRFKQEINKGFKKYLKLLMNDRQVGLQPELIKQLNATVYSRESKQYEKTNNLLKSVRCSIIDNKIIVYIDDEWLSKQSNVTQMSDTKGWALNAHISTANSPVKTPYSLRVEKDFDYKNIVGNNYFRKGSHYMEKTWEDIKNNIFNGKAKPTLILEPLLKVWSNG